MATTQQVIDAKYDIVKAEQAQKLREIFSDFIIGYFKKEYNLSTFEEIQTATEINRTYGNEGVEIKGLSYLPNLTKLNLLLGSYVGKLDLANNSKLTYLNLSYNNFSRIDSIYLLTSLKTLDLTYCSSLENETLDITLLTELESLKMSNFPLQSLTKSSLGFSNLLKLRGEIRLSGLAIPEKNINLYLRNLADIAAFQDANGGVLITSINLSGGTNGTPTGDGITAKNELIALGVTVTTN